MIRGDPGSPGQTRHRHDADRPERHQGAQDPFEPARQENLPCHAAELCGHPAEVQAGAKEQGHQHHDAEPTPAPEAREERLSNAQIAHELALKGSDVQQMTAQLREGIVKKSRP